MKTSLKLLIVFVEYAESNAILLIQAVNTVDSNRSNLKAWHLNQSKVGFIYFRFFNLIKDCKPWCNLMQILGDLSNRDDLELILYSMILINTVLNAIPDQDTFYDVSDAYEEQGMQRIIQHYFKNPVKEDASANYTNYKQIVQQMELYEVKLGFFKLIWAFSLFFF